MSMNKAIRIIAVILVCSACLHSYAQSRKAAVVFQSDFGLKDGAVSAMKGVAIGVSPDLSLFDLTHEIPPFNIWEAAYRLEQTAPYWPAGTVFVSVVDPGVGTSRKSVVLRTKTGHYFVTPDNGTLTLVARSMGIDQLREIDESINRRRQSGRSYTFHGRDVYAYTAARLAAGVISFEQVGKRLPDSVISLPVKDAQKKGNIISGMITVLDPQYGNVWTNIPDSLILSLPARPGDTLRVAVSNRQSGVLFDRFVPLVNTFGEVPEGKPLAYFNSLLRFSIAINMGDLAREYGIGSGPGWEVTVSRK
jgi:S-adenosylmethionine hydrolase